MELNKKVNELVSAEIFNRIETEKVIHRLVSNPDEFKSSFRDFVKQNIACAESMQDLIGIKHELQDIMNDVVSEAQNELAGDLGELNQFKLKLI